MALPSTTIGVLQALQTQIAALTWPSSSDLLVREVVIAADFPVGSPYNLVDNLPACVIVDRGGTYHEENQVFRFGRIGVGIVTHDPRGERSGEKAITGTRGILQIARQLRRALYYQQEVADSLRVSTASGTAVLGDGQTYVGMELTLEVMHQDVVES